MDLVGTELAATDDACGEYTGRSEGSREQRFELLEKCSMQVWADHVWTKEFPQRIRLIYHFYANRVQCVLFSETILQRHSR